MGCVSKCVAWKERALHWCWADSSSYHIADLPTWFMHAFGVLCNLKDASKQSYHCIMYGAGISSCLLFQSQFCLSYIPSLM